MLKMMEGCRDLNQRLEEALLRFTQCEPHTFPVLVSLEKLLRAIAVEADREGADGPIEFGFHA